MDLWGKSHIYCNIKRLEDVDNFCNTFRQELKCNIVKYRKGGRNEPFTIEKYFVQRILNQYIASRYRGILSSYKAIIHIIFYMEFSMKTKNIIMALFLSAFVAAPIVMNADCGSKAKTECAKEAAKEDGMACCKKKMSSKEAKGDNCSKSSADAAKKEVAPK